MRQPPVCDDWWLSGESWGSATSGDGGRSRDPVRRGGVRGAFAHRREAVAALAHEHGEPRSTMLGQCEGDLGKFDTVHAVRHSEAMLTKLVAICSHGVHFLEKVQGVR